MHETSIVYACLKMCILQFMHATSYSINNMIVQLASVRYIIAKAVNCLYTAVLQARHAYSMIEHS